MASLALVGVSSFSLGMTLDALVWPLFIGAVSTQTILMVIRDYTPRIGYASVTIAPRRAFPSRRNRLPLAA